MATHRPLLQEPTWLNAPPVPIHRPPSAVVLDILGTTAAAKSPFLPQRAAAQARIFDTTLSAITDFVYVFDLDGRFLYANQALLDLWGIPLDEAIGKNFFDLDYPAALATRLQQQIQHVIKTKMRISDETAYTSPTGVSGHYEYIFSPVLSHDGAVEVIAGSTRDVTSRTNTAAALKSRTAQYETLLREAPIGVYLVDAKLRILEVNPFARPVFGDIQDLIGRDLSEVLHVLWPPAYATEIVALFRHTLATGAPYVTPERSETRLDSGQTEIYHYQLNRIPLPDGQFGVVCYFQDMSAQVHSRRLLEEADRNKNEFLAMLAHELRNPLASIRNLSEILSRTLAQDSRSIEVVSVVKRQVSQMTRLVDDLLDVSRISQGLIDLQLQVLDLSVVMAQAAEAVVPLLREKRHSLSITKCRLPLCVSADPIRLTQCLTNILTNAAKYTDAGGEIQLISYESGPHAVLSISDNGIGISEELLPRLFDLFVQGDRTAERGEGGLGIGLAVVKRLVEMHGGKVFAANRTEGRGTTFEIWLPRVEATVGIACAPASEVAKSRRILIIDDNADSADSLSMLLEFEGHVTSAAHSAAAGLASIGLFKPNVVLLDLGLPGMDGYEVARRIRKMPFGNALTLVAVTGYGRPEDQERSRLAGFDAHLMKPVDLPKLEHLLAAEKGSL